MIGQPVVHRVGLRSLALISAAVKNIYLSVIFGYEVVTEADGGRLRAAERNRMTERVATALVSDGQGSFVLEKVLTARVGPSDIAVRTSWSGVSIGTEFAGLKGRLDWGPFPVSSGYQATGEVIEVGSDVADFNVGDCVYFRRNASLRRKSTGQPITCRAGTHASIAVLDPADVHGAAKLPAGVPPDVASLVVMPSVGLYGVDTAGVGAARTVVVIGVGMIGLGVVAAAAARGARVIAVDVREPTLELARSIGATAVVNSDRADPEPEIARLTGGAGADYVFESTGLGSMVDLGIRMCRNGGCFVWQGNYGKGQVAFDFYSAHLRQLRMVFPCDDGFEPYREAVLSLIGSGRLPWEKVITHRIDWQDLPDFYDSIYRLGARDVVGAVVNWSGAET